ncbi:hypothetical protein AFGD_005779 [Aspergillus flavus]|nr:hypothetical protein AFGD_005779 [Aspergillus flavus]
MSDTKLWSYYDGCSEGAVKDGARFKLGLISTHLWSQFVEYQLNYYPPYCELEKIVNFTTEACDPLDGRVDGVVSRTHLCKLHFNLNSTIGCGEILNGAHDNMGRRIYMSYQPTAQFQDAVTSYNETTGEYGPFEGVTRDTFRDWIATGFQRYYDSLETTWPDLSVWQKSDPQVPTAGSVRYYESARSIMYPHLSYNQSVAKLNNWYRLFLVPGGAHCGANTLQPNAPWPETTLATLIDWVENGIEPKTLNGTIQSTGEQQQICGWPLRPYFKNNATNPECVYDQKSLDTWKYNLNAFKMPIF